MAAGFFARAARSGKSGAKIFSNSRYANSSRSKATTSLQRKALSTKSNRTSILAITSTNSFNHAFANKVSIAFPPPNCGLLSAVTSCGLHTTSVNAVEGEGSGETGSSVSEATTNTDSAIDPLGVNFPPGDGGGGGGGITETAQDIFASGLPLDIPLSELGLGGYTPVGAITNALDFLHLTCGMPWWGAIVAGTIVFRALVFPLMIKGQINSAKLSAIKPELDRLQENLKEKSNFQNPMMKAQASIELQQLFQKHDCHPAKALITPLIQLPLFVSFFIALRKMSYLPVEALKTGGVLWFPDLTAADPYFILPLLCAGTMLATIETGAEMGMQANDQAKTMKNVFRGMCVVMVPLTYHFPTAIFTYWFTSNILSLVQVGVMRVPGVKEYFGIPPTIVPKIDPSVKQGSFIENLRAGYKGAIEAAHVQHEEKMKEREYKSSLKNTYEETFDYNPKRVQQNEEIFEESKKTAK
eukprot:TCONS_00016579-protein